MKRYLLFLLFFSMQQLMQAQNIVVESFRLDESDLTAITEGTIVMDQYEKKCALIKVETTQTGFSFDVGRLGVRETQQKVGEIWVYVPEGVKRITISHPEFGVLRDYDLGQKLKRAKTYIMKLAIGEVQTMVRQAPTSQYVVFQVTPPNAVVELDGEKLNTNDGMAMKMMPFGTYDYRVDASDYKPEVGKVTVNDPKNKHVVNVTLKPSMVPVTLTVDNEAEIWVNGELKGTGSWQGNLDVGTCEIETRKANHRSVSVTRDIQGSSTIRLLAPPPILSEKDCKVITVGNVSFTMIRVDGGTFTMGATSEQVEDARDDEKPAHQVTLSTYYIGETEVTQALWQAVMGKNPSGFKGDNRPVEQVSWNDCQSFIKQLNKKTGLNFRLPTEAEWEYAARGGSKSRGYKYAGSNTSDIVAWLAENSLDKGRDSPDFGTHDVATKQANELGIYDMSGNVWEWCSDWFGSYTNSPQTNPTGPIKGSSKRQYLFDGTDPDPERIQRGGSWNFTDERCRLSFRDSNLPSNKNYFLGLRLALQ